MGQGYQVSTAPARLSFLIAQVENDEPAATLLKLIVFTNGNVAQ